MTLLSDLAHQQRALETNTAVFRNDTAQISPFAASHTGNAQGHMQQAQRFLAADRTETNALIIAATNAVSRQIDALKELYAARDLLEKQLAGVQEKLGSTNSEASLAAAAAGIDKAQHQIERALSQLQAPPPGLLQSLLQQQQQIAEALNHLTPRETPHTQLRDAHSSASAAAQGLAQMNLPAAVLSMRGARAAMEQAVAAGQEMDGKVSALAAQQAKVQQLAEALLGTQHPEPSALTEAGQMLAEAGEMIAGQGQMPASAQASVESAQAALASGAAQAFAGQAAPARANAAAAAEALAKAQSALALAQAGLNSQTAKSGQQGQVPGQGQGTGDGQNAGEPNSTASPNANGNGRTGNWAGNGGGDRPRRETQGQGRFTGLPPRERAALLQSQAEKYPQEYGPLIEQYLKNLSDETSP
jgi:hypothetical protein